MNKIILNCQQCGGTLEIAEDMEVFKCEYCAMPYLVERTEGSVHITQLEVRVTRVEHEQERLRLDLARTKLEEVRREIENVYDELTCSMMDSNAAGGKFREAAAERLYQEELVLRREYAQLVGDEPAGEPYINPLEVIALIEQTFPKWRAWQLGVWFDAERTPVFGSWFFCPGIRSRMLLARLDPRSLVSFMRQSNEIKVKNLGRRDKKKVIALLQEQYPHRLVK